MQQLVTGMATMCARNTVNPIASGAKICKQRPNLMLSTHSGCHCRCVACRYLGLRRVTPLETTKCWQFMCPMHDQRMRYGRHGICMPWT